METNNIFNNEPILNRNALPDTTTRQWVPEGVMSNVVSFIDPSNDARVYHLECLENFAPERHPLLDDITKYAINSRRSVRGIHKCPECGFIGFLLKSDAPCVRCSFKSEEIRIPENCPETVKKQLISKAFRHYMQSKATALHLEFPHMYECLGDVIPVRKTLPVSLLLLSASRLGRSQSQNEVVYHSFRE
jgi:hypothetical protein